MGVLVHSSLLANIFVKLPRHDYPQKEKKTTVDSNMWGVQRQASRDSSKNQKAKPLLII